MQVQRVSGTPTDPTDSAWGSVSSTTLSLAPAPIASQPTEYIRVAYADRPYGTVSSVDAKAAHDGEKLYVRLEWADSETPNTEFPDAAGVLFPAAAGASPATFGTADAPVRLAQWQANAEGAKSLEARGPGVFAKTGTNGVAAAASLDAGRWAVVISCDLAGVSGDARLGAAVWDGSNDERAGLGAVTPDWAPLEIEG